MDYYVWTIFTLGFAFLTHNAHFVGTANEGYSGFQRFHPESSMTTFVRQGSQALSHRSIEPLDERRIERASSS